MNQYVTGAVIKELREKNRMTQLQLAEKLGVSDKSVSKWETSRGLPDICFGHNGVGFEKTLYSDSGDDNKELVLNAKYRLCN